MGTSPWSTDWRIGTRHATSADSSGTPHHTGPSAIKATVLKYALSKTDLGQVYSGMKTKNGKVAKAIKRIMDAMPDNEVGY